jgi:hypothetical protein
VERYPLSVEMTKMLRNTKRLWSLNRFCGTSDATVSSYEKVAALGSSCILLGTCARWHGGICMRAQDDSCSLVASASSADILWVVHSRLLVVIPGLVPSNST